MAQDLGLTEEEVMNNLNFTGSAIGDPIPVAMPKENAESCSARCRRISA